MDGQIFISYRREDSSAWARLLSTDLSNHFPSYQIFMDVDSVDPGEDFVRTIEETVGSCNVLIAVIGKGWVTSSDQEGQRRLDNQEDRLRIEIATALERDIRVIPVLVDGASMPTSRDLPDDLKPLVRKNALEVGHTRFKSDCARLIATLERILERARAEQVERLQAGQRENERLESEQREKERLQREKERLETEQGEGTSAEPGETDERRNAGKPNGERRNAGKPNGGRRKIWRPNI